MSDEIDLFWESLISSGRGKRQTKSKKSKNGSKRTNNITLNTNDIIPKKKKKSMFNEVMQSKKDKKKKKKKLLDLNSLLGSSDTTATSELKPDLSNLRSSSNIRKQKSDHSIKDSKKKRQKKKKVAFDLPHDNACVKRPTFATAHPKFTKKCTGLEKAAVTDVERASPVSEIEQHHSQLQDNDIPWDENNSQDLFITQKTCRSSSSDSGEEASDKSTTTTSQQTEILDNCLDQIKYVDKDSCRCSQKKKRQKTVKARSAEKDRLHSRKKKYSFQTEGASPTKCLCSFHSSPKVMNLYMDKMAIDACAPKVTKSKQYHHQEIQPAFSRSLHIPFRPTMCTSTQTENFFTDELSSYFAFSTKKRLALCSDLVKPLDLSLPQRARKDLNRCSYVKVSSEVKVDEKWAENKPSAGEIHAPPFCCSSMKDLEMKKELCGSEKGRGETAPNPLTESDPKSGDTTTSSDYNEPSGQSKKVDLNQVSMDTADKTAGRFKDCFHSSIFYQVRPVQMRLNESFFFKTKGDGHSPRPESPLMKLSQSRVNEKDMRGKRGR
ncbi:uncharacterized protein LOC127598312 isoform X1 [Hippocampus zosterae]|uniref:uncharacterized protein LOC127598312 isoform X1 n=1 Tax=Hippocampus zosterae TaxID=109293 RepID=UPI00223D6157|nr:uncharacterized protein LOC127598312 isoform X1 [Hippocampus zosterae]XP_051918058.1 uncharacterized protein LOC127598312 isoform X1 [Hippocampus zosterae]